MSLKIENLSFEIDDLRTSYTSFANFTSVLFAELKNSLQHDFHLLTNSLLA